MYRKYYSYNDMPQPVYERPAHHAPAPEPVHKKEKEICESDNNNKLFGKFENDDIILAIVVIMLLDLVST